MVQRPRLSTYLDVSVDVNAAESIYEEKTPWREKTMFN